MTPTSEVTFKIKEIFRTELAKTAFFSYKEGEPTVINGVIDLDEIINAIVSELWYQGRQEPDISETLSEMFNKIAKKQQPLGAEFEKILEENLQELIIYTQGGL